MQMFSLVHLHPCSHTIQLHLNPPSFREQQQVGLIPLRTITAPGYYISAQKTHFALVLIGRDWSSR